MEEQQDGVTHENKEQRATISIYFNIEPNKYVSRIYEYPHVSFCCEKNTKNVHIHASTIGPNHGGSSGSAGSYKLEEVNEELINLKVLKVLREIYK